jgi:hypothetical protein
MTIISIAPDESVTVVLVLHILRLLIPTKLLLEDIPMVHS